MQFALKVSSLLSIAYLLTPATAVNINFHFDVMCGGSSLNAYNIGAYTCASVSGGGSVKSVYFDGIPSGAKGQAYSSPNTCSYWAADAYGTTCISTGSNYWTAANWFWPSKRLVRKADEDRESLLPTRYSVTFELDSTTREVEIAPADLDRAWKLLQEEDYETLNQFPTVSPCPVKFTAQR